MLSERFTKVVSSLQRARLRIEALERDVNEPIAIVGIGCRFPGGADSPQKFWELLERGFDGTGEIPASRFDWKTYYNSDPKAQASLYTSRGAFIDRIDMFDADFFSISPREAGKIDPQQRLLLELAWETFEQGGISADDLRKSKTGVFVGISTDDYIDICTDGGRSLEALDMYSSLGNSRSVAAGRISSLLGLQGPALQVDTACSSSLVAVHLACQSLRQRECTAALAGGVNLILSPRSTVSRCRMQALSRDGRCKTFSALADGYGQGEGGGLVLLKTLSKARADGDTVFAVIRGSAVNHNGPSSGLTVPNEDAQVAVIEAALKCAGVDSGDVDYVEAHGTGTALGDPLEINALARVFAERRAPLVVGSVKSNIGHLEAAAGIACLIKTALSIHHGRIPAHLHFEQPNPRIPWDTLAITIPTGCKLWPDARPQRLCGVSSFGISGTNAHAILSACGDEFDRPLMSNTRQYLVPLSAEDDTALRDVARRLRDCVDDSKSIEEIAVTMAVGRSHRSIRQAVVAKDPGELRERLATIVERNERFERNVSEVRPVFLFTGQGSQYSGMGRELFENDEVFRAAVLQCESDVRDLLDVSLVEVMFNPAYSDLLGSTRYTQPALFCLEYALSRLLGSWGVTPSALIGHSIGEYVAACLAEVMSPRDALRLVAQRAQLMQSLPRDVSGMLAIATDVETVTRLIEHCGADLSVAAINSPHSVVVSGQLSQIERVSKVCSSGQIPARPLVVSHAFHSSQMDPILNDFHSIASRVYYSKPRIPIGSNRSGSFGVDIEYSADYWVSHLREPVQFSKGIGSILAEGFETFVEVGPRPILLTLARECAASSSGSRTWIPTLRPGSSDRVQLLQALSELYARGAQIDWREVHKGSKARRIPLPTYPWQKKRHWVDSRSASEVEGATIARLIEKHTESLSLAELSVLERFRELVDSSPSSGGSEGLRNADVETYGLECVELQISPPDKRNPHEDIYVGATADANLARCLGAALIEVSALGTRLTEILSTSQSDRGSDGPPIRIILVVTEDATLASATSDLREVLEIASTISQKSSLRVSLLAVLEKDDPRGFALASLARSVGLEYPALWGCTISCPIRENLYRIKDILAANSGLRLHDTLSVESTQAPDGIRLRTLRLVQQVSQKRKQLSFSKGRTHLVVGGGGAAGMALCKWLNRLGVTHIQVTGRSPVTDLPKTLAGTEISYTQCSVSQRESMSELVGAIARSSKPLGGVWHLAGVAERREFADSDRAFIERILEPKVRGAQILHELTRDIDLECFVMFSSLSSVLGAAGHSVYAEANGYLDGLAAKRRSMLLPATCVSFGPWTSGLLDTDKGVADTLSRQGVSSISFESSFAALEGVIASGKAHAIVASIDWSRFRAIYEGAVEKPLLATIRATSSRPSAKAARIFSPDAETRCEELEELIVSEIREIMQLEAHASVDRERGFFDMGMDSLMAVELKERVESQVGVVLSRTCVFNYPSARKLSIHISDLLRDLGATPKVEIEVTKSESLTASEPSACKEAVSDMSAAELEAIIDKELGRLMGTEA